MGAKINVNDQFLNEAMRLAGMPTSIATQSQMQRSQYLLVGFTHLANRSGNIRRATQAFEYGYYDNQSQVDPHATDFLLAHFPRRPYGPAFYYSSTQVKSYEQERRPMYLVEQADSLWNVAPFGYFVTDAALDSLRLESRPTAWIVPSAGRLPDDERRKLQALAPLLTADSAAKLSPIRATGRGRAWGFWDHESSLVVLVSNPDSILLNTTLSVEGLRSGEWQVSYLGIQDSAKLATVTSNYTLPMNIAGYDTRAYLLRQVSISGVRPAAASAKPHSKQRIGESINAVELLDRAGRYRDASGKFRLPN